MKGKGCPGWRGRDTRSPQREGATAGGGGDHVFQATYLDAQAPRETPSLEPAADPQCPQTLYPATSPATAYCSWPENLLESGLFFC